MKRLVIIAATAVSLLGCGTSRHAGGMTKSERKEARRSRVEQAADSRRFVIEVNTAQPRRYPQVQLSYGYSLEVAGDTIKSYLPYYGRAYNIPYGGGKGLDFTAPIKSYSDSGMKRGMRTIEIGTETGEDAYVYRIELSEDGYAGIEVFSKERESIAFRGEMGE